jgi:hypothetical protein
MVHAKCHSCHATLNTVGRKATRQCVVTAEVARECHAAPIHAATDTSTLHSIFDASRCTDHDGMCPSFGRSTSRQWQSLLRQQVPAVQNMSLTADSSPIFEVLNVAWAGTTAGLLGDPVVSWHHGLCCCKTRQGAFTKFCILLLMCGKHAQFDAR